MTDDTGPMGPVTYGVLLEFGFGYSEKHKRWRARFDLGCRNTKKTHILLPLLPHTWLMILSLARISECYYVLFLDQTCLSPLMRKHI